MRCLFSTACREVIRAVRVTQESLVKQVVTTQHEHPISSCELRLCWRIGRYVAVRTARGARHPIQPQSDVLLLCQATEQVAVPVSTVTAQSASSDSENTMRATNRADTHRAPTYSSGTSSCCNWCSTLLKLACCTSSDRCCSPIRLLRSNPLPLDIMTEFPVTPFP